MIVTIDASVFVACAKPTEPAAAASRQCLERLTVLAATVVCPVLILPECAGAVARALGDAQLAADVVAAVRSFPRMRLAGISASLATHAAELAGRHRLRGADSVYVAVACAYGADLITLDHEMLARGAAAVPTFAPMDWLGRHGTAGTGAAP